MKFVDPSNQSTILLWKNLKILMKAISTTSLSEIRMSTNYEMQFSFYKMLFNQKIPPRFPQWKLRIKSSLAKKPWTVKVTKNPLSKNIIQEKQVLFYGHRRNCNLEHGAL